MPKRTPAKTGFPRDPATCFASRHLSATHYKVYDVIFACAFAKRREREGNKATGPLIFNASIKPWLCNAVPVSQNYAHTVIDQLLDLGWLILVREGARRENGQQAPNEYRVVDHGEFVAAYPGSCPPNMFAPDGKTAEAFGVSYGDRFGGGIIPKNFWPSEDTSEGAALRKFLGEEVGIISDEESDAVRKLYAADHPTRDTATDHPTRETVQASRPHNRVAAVPAVGWQPSPQLGASRPHNSGENPYTASVTASTHNTHTKPATTIVDKVAATAEGRVCDVLKTNQKLNNEEAENEVAALLKEFVAQNDGEPGKCTTNQKRELKRLASDRGRQDFRAAARAWFAHHPWDSRTTDPFSAFIAGFDGYAAKKAHSDDQKARQAKQEADAKCTTEWNSRKVDVDYTGKFDPQFLATLSQEDHAYIKQVVDADTLEELPPYNGRNYHVEEIKFLRANRAEQTALTDKAIKDGNW